MSDRGSGEEKPVPVPTGAVSTEDVEESLMAHSFARPHRAENDRVIARWFATPFLFCSGAILSALVVLGCALPSFSLELLGLVGVAVEAGQRFEEASTDFSLFRMVKVLFNQADFTSRIADYIGLGSFAALLVVTVLMVPLAQTALLLYHWIRPMTRSKRTKVVVANEVLQAWQYTEVYALAVLVGSW